MADLIGQIIGNYRVDAVVGKGGMGAVYRATHLELGRSAAIKVMHPHLADDLSFQARFRHEARAAAALNHPNIVQVYDFGEDAGRYYLAMELVPDGSIGALFTQTGGNAAALPIGIDLVRQAAEGLAYAHRRGMVHRDVKPDNLMIERLDPSENQGHPYRLHVCDFGLIQLAEGSLLTASGITLGTPAYMSPEQCLGREVDARSDQYSLGLVLYEVATGQKPFTIRSIADAAYQHVHVAPTPPRVLRPELTEALQDIILTCLAKQPDDRFSSCDALARALAALGPLPLPRAAVDLASTPTIRDEAPRLAHLAPSGTPVATVVTPPASEMPVAAPPSSNASPMPAAGPAPTNAPPTPTPAPPSSPLIGGGAIGQAALPPTSQARRTLVLVGGLLVLALAVIVAVQLLRRGDNGVGGVVGKGANPTVTHTASGTSAGEQVPAGLPTSTVSAIVNVTATFTPPSTATPTPVPQAPTAGEILHHETWPDADGLPAADGSRGFSRGGAQHFVIPAGSPGFYQVSEYVATPDSSITIEVQMLRGGPQSEGCLYRIDPAVGATAWQGAKFCLLGNGTLTAYTLVADPATAENVPLKDQIVDPTVSNALTIVTRGTQLYFIVNDVLLGTAPLATVTEGRIRYAVGNALSSDGAEFVFANLTVRAVVN